MTDIIWCGVDPGLVHCGIAFLERQGHEWHALIINTVNTEPKDSMRLRLYKIWISLRQEFGVPVRYAFESQTGARMGHQAEGTTNHHAVLLERVIGMVYACGFMQASSTMEVTPRFMRKVLGLPARATKEQIAKVVRRLVKGLPKKMSSHAYEACGMAIAGAAAARAEEILLRGTRLKHRRPSS